MKKILRKGFMNFAVVDKNFKRNCRISSSSASMSTLTHIDADQNQPMMVDVSKKTPTLRTAKAQSKVRLPMHVVAALVGENNNNENLSTSQKETTTTAKVLNEIHSAKGPVFATAIVAGTMAAKRTSDLIPFCHPLPLSSCKLHIALDSSNGIVTIECEAKVTHTTGVEMEALVGASAAALTVYDMCKALSHDIVIEETRLILKKGGKSDFLEGK